MEQQISFEDLNNPRYFIKGNLCSVWGWNPWKPATKAIVYSTNTSDLLYSATIPDILSKATYEVFGDGTHGSKQQQQQYTVPTHQIYYTQPQLKTEAIEILVKKINDL